MFFKSKENVTCLREPEAQQRLRDNRKQKQVEFSPV